MTNRQASPTTINMGEPPQLGFHPVNVLALIYLWVLSIAEYVVRVKVFIYSENRTTEENEPCLIIMNHVGNLDWLHFYRVITELFKPPNYRIVLKKPLSNIPGAGSAMEFTNFLFITRKMEQDCRHIDQYIHYHKKNNLPIQLLLFCEGTFMNPVVKIKSDKYATKHGLPKYEHVLHPRTTGFKHILSQATSSDSNNNNNNNNNESHTNLDDTLFKRVYDITIGYKGFPSSIDVESLKGNFGNEFHFLVEKFDINQLPIHNDQLLDQWLTGRWRVKEDSLQYFHQHGHFCEQTHTRNFVKFSDEFRVIYVFHMAILTISTVFAFYMSLTNPYVGVYTIVAIITLGVFHVFNVQFSLYNR